MTFASAEAARRLVDCGLPPLRGRDVVVELDAVSSALLSSCVSSDCGWLRCKSCGEACGSLIDIYLVEGIRPPGPGYAPDTDTAYFCLCAESAATNCSFQDHPSRHWQPFKLMKATCTCGQELGNVQDGPSIVGEDWCTRLGPRLMCFKCQSVVLELVGANAEVLDVKKWSVLYSAVGDDCRLSTVTVHSLAPKLRAALSSHRVTNNSNRDMRLVTRRHDAGPSRR